MAQVHEVRLVDDLSGAPADETVEFGLDGRDYAIELTADNAQRLREGLSEFVRAARRQASSPVRRPVRGAQRPSVEREQNQAIRVWARQRGMKVSDRGRIPARVIEAYHDHDHESG